MLHIVNVTPISGYYYSMTNLPLSCALSEVSIFAVKTKEMQTADQICVFHNDCLNEHSIRKEEEDNKTVKREANTCIYI